MVGRLKKIERRVFGQLLEGILERVFVWGPAVLVSAVLISTPIVYAKDAVKSVGENVSQFLRNQRAQAIIEQYDGNWFNYSDEDRKRFYEVEKKYRGKHSKKFTWDLFDEGIDNDELEFIEKEYGL